jgi:hypothetical protein
MGSRTEFTTLRLPLYPPLHNAQKPWHDFTLLSDDSIEGTNLMSNDVNTVITT